MTEDERQLDLLSTFHYVLGGLAALFSFFPFIHVGIGLMMVFADFNGEAPPPFFGWLFVGIGGLFILLGWTAAALMITAGKKLRRRVSRSFCLVVGAIECLVMPLGTILGVFTIVTLTKDSVKNIFDSGDNPVVQGGPD